MSKCQKTVELGRTPRSGTSNVRLVSELVQLLLSARFKGVQFEPPLTNVVHCLLNLPLANSESDLFPNSGPTKVVERLINILDRSVPQDTDAISDKTLDEHLSPVVGLLNQILEVSPVSVKRYMKESILPSEAYTYYLTYLILAIAIYRLANLKASQVACSVSQ